MFKIGDEVVCIDSVPEVFNDSIVWYEDDNIKKGKTYTVQSCGRLYMIVFESSHHMLDPDRFISLIEYRKIKLERICSKLVR